MSNDRKDPPSRDAPAGDPKDDGRSEHPPVEEPPPPDQDTHEISEPEPADRNRG